MPRLYGPVLDCSIYLYHNTEFAQQGTRAGGSGFLCGYPMPTGEHFIYAVSNWHVVRDAPIIRLNTALGEFDILTDVSWIRHPDLQTDLAIAQIEFRVPSAYRVSLVGYDILLTKEKLESFDIGIGDDLFTVGRFVNHDGVQRNEPTVRFGNLAQMNNDPIYTDIGKQDAFLAEIRSIAGYSGAPVFGLIPARRDFRLPKEKRLNPRHGAAYLLLGIDCGHTTLDDTNISVEPVSAPSERRHLSRLWSEINTGLAIVIGAWKLDEMLNLSEVKAMRDGEAKQRKKASAHTALDLAHSQTQKTLAPKEEDRIDIPIPTEREVLDVFKKVTRKRDKKS
jgi:hypothetical protein